MNDPGPDDLVGERVRLVAFDLALTQAVVDGDRTTAAALLGVPSVPVDWAVDVRGALAARGLGAVSPDGWCPWAVLAPEFDGTVEVVGDLGYHGPPLDGLVEVGYALVPAARGRGLATEALRLLLEQHAFPGAHGRVDAAVAHTHVDNLPSQRVLERAGFHETGRSRGAVAWRRDRG